MMKNCSKISVVVPLYHGQKYVEQIIGYIEKNIDKHKNEFSIELIMVNDAPKDVIEIPNVENEYLYIVLINNPVNCGIHQSRINGLQVASGEYVHFLDQDDEIVDDFYSSQLRCIGSADVVVGNGIVEYQDYCKCLYRYAFMQWTIKHDWFYVAFDCRIISPGQCLIRRSSIPSMWCSNVLKMNGTDDYYLWLTMLNLGCKFKCNREVIYVHKYTTTNLSLNIDKMKESLIEGYELFEGYISARANRYIRYRIEGKKKKTWLETCIERINRV